MTDAAPPNGLSWPRHTLTLAEWEALPDDGALRLELVEGALVMPPQPFAWHQHAIHRLAGALDAHIPAALTRR